RITAPKHAIQPSNCLAMPKADLNLVPVSFVLISFPLFLFLVRPFTEVLQEIRRGITQKAWDLSLKPTDWADFTGCDCRGSRVGRFWSYQAPRLPLQISSVLPEI